MYKQILNRNGSIDNTQIQRLPDNACIPFAPDNTDYQAYLLWKSEGNEPLPADE